jgi:hypothetical protein
MQPFEIFYAAQSWKNCEDERPWLIIDLRPNNIFGCFPISGECYGGQCFFISSSHPDFAATGLAKSSNVDDRYIIELGLGQFRRRLGGLTGELLREFKDYAGF